MQNVTGPTAAPIETQEQIERRHSIQAFVLAHLEQPKEIMHAMTSYGVSIPEMQAIMSHKMDFIHYLRSHAVPDGFMGLKVWSDAEIAQFVAWQAKQPSPAGGTQADIWLRQDIFDPLRDMRVRLQAQDALDLNERRKTTNPAHVAEWA